MATGMRYNSYPTSVFIYPRKVMVLHKLLQRWMAEYLSAALDVDMKSMRDKLMGRKFVLWGKMQQVSDSGPGDLIYSPVLSNSDSENKTCNVLYVKVSQFLHVLTMKY